MLKLQGETTRKHLVGFGHWMFGGDPKSQGKKKTLMNEVYHKEILGYSREHSLYNKGE